MSDSAFQVKNGLVVNTSIFVVDTSQNAAIIANILYVGNTSSNVAIYAANGFFSGVAASALTIAGSTNFVNSSQLAANLSNYATLAGLAANVVTVTNPVLQTLVQNNAGSNTTTWTPANSVSTMAYLTLTSNTIMGVPSNFANGTYILYVQQANGGSHTITWYANNWFFPAGVAPVLTTANGAIDIISLVFNSAVNNAGNTTLFGTYAPNFLG
jgi:hypothetical protein